MPGEELQMAESHARHSVVPDWLRTSHSRGCIRERGTALHADDLRRDDGAPRLSPQGRKEWENEWATVAFVPDGDKGLDSEAGKPAGRYVYLTSTPQDEGKLQMAARKYPYTLNFLIYISAVVTLLLILQVIYRG